MRLVLPEQKHALKTAACLGCLLLCLLAACSPIPLPSDLTNTAIPASPVPATAAPIQRETPGATVTLAVTIPAAVTHPPATVIPTATPLPPNFWQSLPVIPTQLSPRVREIYQNGLALGNHPHVFSRIGDCNSAAPAFLVGFDGPYNLGAYSSLQPAIDYFQGSFKRPSLAAKAGLNSAGLLTTLWTGQQCQKDESLLDCQYRLDRPSFAFIAIGTNEAYYVQTEPGAFERNMRQILDDTISKGIVPILSTKADNVEGDGSINATIARLAVEYQVPLWNFWLAAQSLPGLGMVDPEHLNSVSYANFVDFSIPTSLEHGIQMHNLTALQMLDFLRQQLAGTPAVESAATPTP
jgi:hypothetical protein